MQGWPFRYRIYKTVVILSDERSEESKDPYRCVNSPAPIPKMFVAIEVLRLRSASPYSAQDDTREKIAERRAAGIETWWTTRQVALTSADKKAPAETGAGFAGPLLGLR